MMGFKKLFLLLVLICWSSIGISKKKDCQKLLEELNLMKKTQYQIIQSLASNHAAMADASDEISDLIDVIPADQSDEIANRLKSNGKAFRLKGLQAQKMNDSLNQLTEKIISKTATCF